MAQVVLTKGSALWTVAVSSGTVTVDTITNHGLTAGQAITTNAEWTANTFMNGLSVKPILTPTAHSFSFTITTSPIPANQTATVETNAAAVVQNQLEPTTALVFSDLLSETGFFAGFGSTSGNWSASQLAILTNIVQNAYRKFLAPPALDKGGEHNWTWRWVWRDLAINSSTKMYPLWDDFAGVAGKILYCEADYSWVTVKIVPAATIREMFQFPNMQVYRPHMAAVEAMQTDGTFYQRWQLTIWPGCSGNFTLRVLYKPTVPLICSAAPYPQGGAPYADLLRQFCLAEAETQLNDNAAGVQNQRLQERLRAAIYEDMRNTEPDHIGTNRDFSDRPEIMPNNLYRCLYVVAPTGDIPGI